MRCEIKHTVLCSERETSVRCTPAHLKDIARLPIFQATTSVITSTFKDACRYLLIDQDRLLYDIVLQIVQEKLAQTDNCISSLVMIQKAFAVLLTIVDRVL